MKTTTWANDEGLVQTVFDAVAAALEEIGVTQHPGRAWVQKRIKKADDGDWGSASVREDNTKDIARAALEWANREKIVPEIAEAEPRTSTTQPLTSTSVGQAWATVDKVKRLVEETRTAMWGSPDAPFPQTLEGHEEAAMWLRVQSIKQKGKDAGRVKLEFTYELESVRDSYEVWVKVEQELGGALHEDRPNLLIEAIRQNGGRLQNLGMKGGHKGGDYCRTLVKTDSEGRKRFDAPDGTLLGRLAEQVEAISELVGWWTDQETLDHIMCGSVFIPGATVSHRTTDMDSIEALTITVRGPTTAEEVARAYQEYLERYGFNPKSLTRNAGAVLQLVHRMPESDYTWQQRLERWNEWRKEDEALREYKDYPALRRAYVNALERITWGKKEGMIVNDEAIFSSPHERMKKGWEETQKKWREAERRAEAEAPETA